MYLNSYTILISLTFFLSANSWLCQDYVVFHVIIFSYFFPFSFDSSFPLDSFVFQLYAMIFFCP